MMTSCRVRVKNRMTVGMTKISKIGSIGTTRGILVGTDKGWLTN
jgi:hypothetical protein